MRTAFAAWIVVAAIGLTLFGGLGAAFADPAPGPSDQPNLTVRIPGKGGHDGGETTPTTSPTPSTGGAPAVAQNPTPNAAHLSLDRRRVHVGDQMTATGHTFTPGEKVQFVVYPERVVLGGFSTDSEGTVVATISVPTRLAPGEHTIEAAGWVSHRVANAQFTIEAGGGESSNSPTWIAWAIGAGGLACGLAAFLVAASNGWLPFLLSTRTVA
ncbi:hypothetical protein [Lacisediminihabitans profunda]|uniref:hypothetical protein n=1 Tax=Lacisediminihabitans profunda TaxID=2594790 RepID=UPI00164FDA0F|nr:hypothetical protein [Lacisediminihabitans profunda]